MNFDEFDLQVVAEEASRKVVVNQSMFSKYHLVRFICAQSEARKHDRKMSGQSIDLSCQITKKCGGARAKQFRKDQMFCTQKQSEAATTYSGILTLLAFEIFGQLAFQLVEHL